MIADATYNGLPLTESAWKAHLALLEGLSRGVQPEVMSLDRAGQDAWIALSQCGHVHDVSVRSTDGSFRWASWALTPMGLEYFRGLTTR